MGVKTYTLTNMAAWRMKTTVKNEDGENEKRTLEFNGGAIHNGAKWVGGIYVTDKKEEQDAIESHPNFKKSILLKIDKADEKVKQEGFRNVPDISNINMASQWIKNNFEDYGYPKGKTKLKEACEELKINFTDINFD